MKAAANRKDGTEKPVTPRAARRRPDKDAATGALASAIAILRRLATIAEPQTVTQLARDLRINPSTCFNILRTLVADDLVVFTPSSKTYETGTGAREIAAGVYRRGLDLARLQQHLNRFARQHDVTATLWRRIGERLVLAASAEGKGPHVIRMRVGQRTPLLLGAIGRCIAAFGGLSEEEVGTHFPRVKWESPMPLDAYRRQVRAAARRGWSRDEGQYASSITSVAAPVTSTGCAASLVVCASMFAGQYDARIVVRIGRALAVLAGQLSPLANVPLEILSQERHSLLH